MKVEDAKRVVLELNVAKPLGGFTRRFVSAIREYLRDKVQKGESLYVPVDIVIEFKLSTWYKWDTPIISIKETEPDGLVTITAETAIKAIFKLSDKHPAEQLDI